MSDHPIIATPHGVEAVEAVVEVEPGKWLARHLDDAITVTVHDTDPRIEPTPQFGWNWADKDEPERDRIYGMNVTREMAQKDSGWRALSIGVPTRLHERPTYPVTLAGKPYTLVGEWVEVES